MKKNNLLYKSIRDTILEDITKMDVDTRIPSRSKLMKRYSVTRTTIDRAISELIGSGYLYSKSGSGTYVSGKSDGLDHKQKYMCWGVIIPSIDKQVGYRMLRGIEDVANNAQTNVILCNSDDYISKQSDYIFNLIHRGIDGLIIDPAMIGEDNPEPFKLLKRKQIPVVYCNLNLRDMTEPCVIPNTYYGALLVTQHLIDTGYKRIAYISMPAVYSSIQRYHGYATALAMNEIEVDASLIVFEESYQSTNPGYDSTIALLKGENRPDAIFAFNDIYAANAYQAITDMGYMVGQDIGLVGYGDTDICTKLSVQLTSIKFGAYETGVKAATLLLDIINTNVSKPTSPILINPKLIIRQSCGHKNGSV